MLNYAICEISGKQYKVVPGQTFEVSLLSPGDKILANVLLLYEDNKLQIGKPYLKEKLTFKRIEDIKGKKIRVSKFHAKANYRKTIGFRPKLTKVVWPVKKT